MVKARIPGSSQELYTVSVESMPQYVTNNAGGRRSGPRCCQGGRVGKDLLCGVLIALGIICAAVAVFLVVYYVTYGTGNSQPVVDGTADHNGTLDSSPLTRHREEESKLNSLNWDHKDHLSLSSTSLPDVGIHEPEFHVEGVKVYPPYSGGNNGHEPADPLPEPPTVSSSTTEPSTTTTMTGVSDDPLSSQPLPVEVEAKSEDIDKKSETTQFVPDDDVIIEDDKVESSSAEPSTTTTTVIPVVINATSSDPEEGGFVPVVAQPEEEVQEEPGAQTEAAPEIPLVKAVTNGSVPLAVDTTPWKPIQAVVFPAIIPANETDIEPRFIPDDTAKDIQAVSSTEKTLSSSSSPSGQLVSSSSAPELAEEEEAEEVQPPSQVEEEEEEESTEFALVHDLGNMALLVPEERIRSNVSSSTTTEESVTSTTTEATTTSSSTTVVPTVSTTSKQTEAVPPVVSRSDECLKRQLPFCRGVLPYSETVLPNWVGDKTEGERNMSVPYFEIIAESECHPRVQQYACAVLEPPCRANGISLPPCRQFCRAIAEDCKSYVLSALALSSVLDCERFPQSNDPNVCLNLASTTPEGECLPGEYRCSSDNTCIPERWVCDGRQDCSQGDDEFSCGQCTDAEFKCESENRCLPQRWRCDGSRDCADGSDERDCPATQECGDGQFRCEDGLSCIPLRRVCDGSNHCRDNSDESNCTSVVCQNDDFKCKENGVCIPRQWICDNNWDCKDGSDEVDCPLNDAELLEEGDGPSDSSLEQLNEPGSEKNGTAASVETAFNPEKCPLGELLCISDMSCIRFEQLCDGTKDCSDGADETDCSSD